MDDQTPPETVNRLKPDGERVSGGTVNAPGETKPSDALGLELLRRPARALIGWFDPMQIDLLFAGPDLPMYREAASRARTAVTQRVPGLEQPDVLSALPKDAEAYVEAWRKATPAAAGAEWRCEVADLRHVVAAQPFVFTDHASERVSKLDSENWENLASFTLPLGKQVSIAGQYDFTKQAYVFASPDPNLRILGNWSGQVEGHSVFGFVVGTITSFMNVGVFRDRVFLRDGYHLALGLLSRGIYRVPVLVQEYAAFEHIGLPQGMLPQDAYLGERPARLPDYLDDEVAVSVTRTATQKLLVIQANELTANR